jgi:hypothetical protein
VDCEQLDKNITIILFFIRFKNRNEIENTILLKMKKNILLGLLLVILFSFPSKQSLQIHLEKVPKHEGDVSLTDKLNNKILISEQDINLEIFEKWNKKNTAGIFTNQKPMKCSSRQRKGKIIYSKYCTENYKTEFE